MQVIIDLHANEPGVHHSNDEAKKRWDTALLYELLDRLEAVGYRIHSLYGSFIFDNENRVAIDIGKPGEIVHSSVGLAVNIHQTGGTLAVVYTDQKYVVFANRYFLAIHLCHMRRVRPISIAKALNRFRALFVMEKRSTLNLLYRRQFEEFYGMDARPVPQIADDHSPHRHGYAIPGPILNGEPDDDE